MDLLDFRILLKVTRCGNSETGGPSARSPPTGSFWLSQCPSPCTASQKASLKSWWRWECWTLVSAQRVGITNQGRVWSFPFCYLVSGTVRVSIESSLLSVGSFPHCCLLLGLPAKGEHLTHPSTPVPSTRLHQSESVPRGCQLSKHSTAQTHPGACWEAVHLRTFTPCNHVQWFFWRTWQEPNGVLGSLMHPLLWSWGSGVLRLVLSPGANWGLGCKAACPPHTANMC